MEKQKIQSFKDLIVWQKGHMVFLEIYRLTKLFPKEELFTLTSQIRRAAISITSNIAEGFGRNSLKEKIYFYNIAYGSLLETKNQLEVAKDLGYIQQKEFTSIDVVSEEVAKMLQSLMKVIKTDY